MENSKKSVLSFNQNIKFKNSEPSQTKISSCDKKAKILHVNKDSILKEYSHIKIQRDANDSEKSYSTGTHINSFIFSINSEIFEELDNEKLQDEDDPDSKSSNFLNSNKKSLEINSTSSLSSQSKKSMLKDNLDKNKTKTGNSTFKQLKSSSTTLKSVKFDSFHDLNNKIGNDLYSKKSKLPLIQKNNPPKNLKTSLLQNSNDSFISISSSLKEINPNQNYRHQISPIQIESKHAFDEKNISKILRDDRKIKYKDSSLIPAIPVVLQSNKRIKKIATQPIFILNQYPLFLMQNSKSSTKYLEKYPNTNKYYNISDAFVFNRHFYRQ